MCDYPGDGDDGDDDVPICEDGTPVDMRPMRVDGVDLKYEYMVCPFCGCTRPLLIWFDTENEETGEILVGTGAIDQGEDVQYQVVCSRLHNGCGASTGWYKSDCEALAAWARRVLPAVTISNQN